jgi:hypothetical protein
MSHVLEQSRGVINQYPYSIQKLKADNSNTSFPSEITDSLLQSYKVYPVSQEARPEISDDKRAVVDNTPSYADGNWSLGWSVKNKTDDEKSLDESSKRRERDELLKATDHYALTDRGLSDDVADYRQALRDFPEEEGFPYIDFPEQPQEVLDDLGGQ